NPRWLGAFVGGVVFAFTPYTLDALKGQPEVLSLQWMPLFVEMWLWATTDVRGQGYERQRGAVRGQQSNSARLAQSKIQNRKSKITYGVLAGVFLALAAYSSLYYAVYLVLFTVALTVYRTFSWPRYGRLKD